MRMGIHMKRMTISTRSCAKTWSERHINMYSIYHQCCDDDDDDDDDDDEDDEDEDDHHYNHDDYHNHNTPIVRILEVYRISPNKRTGRGSRKRTLSLVTFQ